jgi:Domain of unknown function (DUF222)/HNH endonuclease
MELDALAEVIDQMVATDPSAFADTESMVTLQRELARLESVVTGAVAAFDTSGAWAPDGARNASSWLATRCRLPKSQTRRLVRRGRVLSELPVCAQAWSKGEIGAFHLDAISSLRRDTTADVLARDEAMLVDQARTLAYEPWTRALAYWDQLADPDGTDEVAEKRRGRRDVYLEASFSGMWLGQITLDPISGAIVATELARIESELFEADWDKARTELGREPRVDELSRTSGQRRADALVEMATRSRTAPADGRRPAPLFSVLVDYETTFSGRICELAQGMVVTPGSLLPWLDQAIIERAVFGPNTRVEISETTRLFTGATRRAIELRDRQCVHPYCDRAAHDCQIDHIIPFSQGGPTTQENGRVLCGFHNRLRNQQNQRPPPDG